LKDTTANLVINNARRLQNHFKYLGLTVLTPLGTVEDLNANRTSPISTPDKRLTLPLMH
jgi:hypothetical protein